MRKGTGSVLLAVLFLCTACADGRTQTNEMAEGTQTEGAQTESISRTQEEVDGNQDQEEMDPELVHALEYGIVSEDFLAEWDKEITEKEMARMCANAIALCDEKQAGEWEELTRDASDTDTVPCDYAALFVFLTAQRMGSGTFLEWDYYNAFNLWEEKWDRDNRSETYTLFRDFCYDEPEGPLSEVEGVWVWPMDYIDFSLLFATGKISYYSNQPLFGSEPRRCDENMRRGEAFLAVSRLLDNCKDVYTDIDDEALRKNVVGEEAKAAGRKMPSLSGGELPDWNGTSLAREMLSYSDGRELFIKEDARLIRETGFNYVRLMYPHTDFVKEKDGKLYANRLVLENMDEMIGWCMEEGVHVCLDMHSLPGYKVGAESDILENEAHYEQAVKVWQMLSARYADIPSEALSYNLVNEPDLFYFTQESYAGLANDLIGAIRENDAQKLLVSDGMLSDAAACSSVPCEGLSPDIVQTIHLYPTLYDRHWLLFQDWPVERMDAIAGGLNSDVVWEIKGDFTAGTEIDLYYDHICGVNCGTGLVWEINGTDDGGMSFDGIEAGKDGCVAIESEEYSAFPDDAYFAGGTKLTITLTQDSDHVTLKVNGGDRESYIEFREILVKFSTDEEKTYFVPSWENNSGFERNTGKYETAYLVLENGWAEGTVNITVERNGTYHCDRPVEDADLFDMETLRAHIEMWSRWREETGGKVICNEFAVPAGLSVEMRTAYMETLLSLFDEHEIPWAIYTTNLGDYGPIHKKYDDPMFVLPQDGSLEIRGDYAVDKPLIEVLQSHM